MKSDRKFASLMACLVILSLAVAQASDRMQLREARSVSLPSHAILDENAQPLIAASGKVGFVSSVTGGALISFSVTSGKILSSLVVGETVGPISLVETESRRLVSVPSVNDPRNDHPATVSVVDATSARNLDLHALLVLPPDAIITPATRALLTRDGRFCIIASSFNEPALFSFDVETGQLVSRLSLIGRPSEIALFDGESRMVAVASAVANNLSTIRIDGDGHLVLSASFSPSGASFESANNPAFSADGRIVYIAAATGDQLFALDAESGARTAAVSVDSPHRITVGGAPASEKIAVTQIRRPVNAKPGGVAIFAAEDGQLKLKAEFTPPDAIEFSRTNNVAFDSNAEVAFVGSTTGVLFAFSAETGELESFQLVGSELRRVALSERGRAVAAVRSASSGDQVVIIGFDMVESRSDEEITPVIDRLVPNVVEQGRLRNLRLRVVGRNFTEGSSLIVNGVEIAADLTRKGAALEAKLHKGLFDQRGEVLVQVKVAGGALSQTEKILVKRPDDPTIKSLRPAEVPGPSAPFSLRVIGENFRASSTIFVEGQPLTTRLISSKQLEAQVPAEFAGTVKSLRVQVVDLAVADLASSEAELLVYGPRIDELKLSVDAVVAGAGAFGLKVKGVNFREGARVEINGATVPASRVRRLSSNLIRLVVPSRFTQVAGVLDVVVRNAEGSASAPKQIEAARPLITAFEPGKVLAGVSGVRVNLRGANFRERARVYVGRGDEPDIEIRRKRVTFRNSAKMIVSLTGDELKQLLAEKGELKFKVVNPNAAEGVASEVKGLNVVGPEILDAVIKPLSGDDSRVKIVIEGENFRQGALIQFLTQDGEVRLERTPSTATDNRLAVVISARKRDALGDFQVRVVNPGNVASSPERPHQGAVANSSED